MTNPTHLIREVLLNAADKIEVALLVIDTIDAQLSDMSKTNERLISILGQIVVAMSNTTFPPFHHLPDLLKQAKEDLSVAASSNGSNQEAAAKTNEAEPYEEITSIQTPEIDKTPTEEKDKC